MKKILLLGGSAQQIVAIETAKRLGYFTIIADASDPADPTAAYLSEKWDYGKTLRNG